MFLSRRIVSLLNKKIGGILGRGKWIVSRKQIVSFVRKLKYKSVFHLRAFIHTLLSIWVTLPLVLSRTGFFYFSTSQYKFHFLGISLMTLSKFTYSPSNLLDYSICLI